MKLRNLFKNTTKVLLTFLIALGFVSNVAAASERIVVYAEDYKDVGTEWTAETFHIKKLSDGTYVYCAEYARTTPRGKTYTLGKEITEVVKNENRLPVIVGVMKGSMNFMMDLLKHIEAPV